jgi:predicted amidophosphoribosyltransferase
MAGSGQTRVKNIEKEINMPLISCPECSQEISDRAIACPRCGFPVKETIELSAMVWDSEDDVFVCVKCPKCKKESKIRKAGAHKTKTGYSLDGEGTCSCGLTFDKIEKREVTYGKRLVLCNSCKKEINSVAEKCPHCGAAHRPFFHLVVSIITFFVLVFLIKAWLSN